jgi:hypothetical protein
MVRPLPVHVCRIAPPGYEHHRAFDEIVETLQHAIANLGHPVSVHWNSLPATGLNIVIGAHLLDAAPADALGPGTVVYNFEQVERQTGWTRPETLRALRRATVWDYSARNLELIAAMTGNRRLVHVPVGYVPALTRIAAADPQDIDVLFYGSTNDRRARALERVHARGLRLHRAFGVYGAARDALIARAKVVLNLHFHRARVLEIVRVSYLLANRKAVVCECDARTEMPADLRGGMRLAAYEDLPEACAELVADAAARTCCEDAGFAWMSTRGAEEYLRAPLGAAIAARVGAA